MYLSAASLIRQQMKDAGRGYRTVRCEGCGLPVELCICGELPRVAARIAITFVVHTREWSKPTNTARVALRMLTESRVVIRGGPNRQAGAVAEQTLALLQPSRAVLLFPSPTAVPITSLRDTSDTELVVPDGTWAQTRRLVRRHRILQQMRHVSICERDTLYRLRRGSEPGLLCTLEAVAWALAALEPNGNHALLMRGFERWQARAMAYRGRLAVLQDADYQALARGIDS